MLRKALYNVFAYRYGDFSREFLDLQGDLFLGSGDNSLDCRTSGQAKMNQDLNFQSFFSSFNSPSTRRVGVPQTIQPSEQVALKFQVFNISTTEALNFDCALIADWDVGAVSAVEINEMLEWTGSGIDILKT